MTDKHQRMRARNHKRAFYLGLQEPLQKNCLSPRDTSFRLQILETALSRRAFGPGWPEDEALAEATENARQQGYAEPERAARRALGALLNDAAGRVKFAFSSPLEETGVVTETRFHLLTTEHPDPDGPVYLIPTNETETVILFNLAIDPERAAQVSATLADLAFENGEIDDATEALRKLEERSLLSGQRIRRELKANRIQGPLADWTRFQEQLTRSRTDFEHARKRLALFGSGRASGVLDDEHALRLQLIRTRREIERLIQTITECLFDAQDLCNRPLDLGAVDLPDFAADIFAASMQRDIRTLDPARRLLEALFFVPQLPRTVDWNGIFAKGFEIAPVEEREAVEEVLIKRDDLPEEDAEAIAAELAKAVEALLAKGVTLSEIASGQEDPACRRRLLLGLVRAVSEQFVAVEHAGVLTGPLIHGRDLAIRAMRPDELAAIEADRDAQLEEAHREARKTETDPDGHPAADPTTMEKAA